MPAVKPNTIAGAVSLEIERIAAGHQPDSTQGAAYKGAWDRAGSGFLKHCEAADMDRAVVSFLSDPGGACYPRASARDFAAFEARRGPK
jgi:hypothetical protein